jgi:hypothetical protein
LSTCGEPSRGRIVSLRSAISFIVAGLTPLAAFAIVVFVIAIIVRQRRW